MATSSILSVKGQYEASLLEKYDAFPTSFIECVKNGVSWLITHNGITYQSSTMVATDTIVYETNKTNILRIGLINVDKPLSGLTYYEVRTIKEELDSVSGNTIYRVELNYTAPVGIKVVMVPVKYYNPYENSNEDYYTKDQVDAAIQTQISTLTQSFNQKLELLTNISSNTVNDSVSTIEASIHSLAISVQEVNRDLTTLTGQFNKLYTQVNGSDNMSPSVTIPTEDSLTKYPSGSTTEQVTQPSTSTVIVPTQPTQDTATSVVTPPKVEETTPSAPTVTEETVKQPVVEEVVTTPVKEPVASTPMVELTPATPISPTVETKQEEVSPVVPETEEKNVEEEVSEEVPVKTEPEVVTQPEGEQDEEEHDVVPDVSSGAQSEKGNEDSPQDAEDSRTDEESATQEPKTVTE